jgi:hypothetical protein
MIQKISVNDALHALCPGAQWTLRGGDIDWQQELDTGDNPTGNYVAKNIEWYSSNISFPTKDQIDLKMLELQIEYESLEYQRLRQLEYPPLADLADALYWQSQGDDSKMTAYLAAVDAVKTKYPKGVK